MIAVDTLEQLDPAGLDPEHPDTRGDRGPFVREVVRDERLGQGPHLQLRDLAMTPDDRAVARQCRGTVQFHRPARKTAQMRGCIGAAVRLVEPRPLDAHQRIAPEHQRAGVAPRNILRLGPGQRERDCRGIGRAERGLHRPLIDLRGIAGERDPRRLEHRPARRAFARQYDHGLAPGSAASRSL